MDTIYYSDQTYDLLAHQLVEEQAELVKHQGSIDSIKKAIFQKKRSVISEIVFFHTFMIEGKRYLGASVHGKIEGDKMRFEALLLRDREDLSKLRHLTKKEKELLTQLDKVYFGFLEKGWEPKIYDLSDQFFGLKHNIEILRCFSASFSFDDAMKPVFFKTTGIEADRSYRIQLKVRMLEDCRINY